MTQLEVINKSEDIKESVAVKDQSVTQNQQDAVENFVKQFKKNPDKEIKKEESDKENNKKVDKIDLVNTSDIITNFNSNSELILNNIENNIKEKIKDQKVDRNKADDPTVNTFIEAQKAFETDLKEYSGKEGGGVLLNELKKAQGIGDMIKNKQTEKERNKNSLQESLNKNRTTETAKNFFETSNNKESFDITFDAISKIVKNNKLDTNAPVFYEKTEVEQVKNFTDLIKKYAKDDKISDIYLKTATKDDKVYPEGTRVITFTFKETIEDKTNDVTKEIIFGSQDQMQKTKSEKFDNKADLSIDNPLAQFDGKGNYRSFEKYITNETNKTEFGDHFKNMINAIIAYEKPKGDTKNADKYESENDLKNGYGNVLTDYMVGHPELLGRYITYFTPGNLNILGADKATRIANYNKLLFSNVKNNILRPDINNMLSKITDESEKKDLLQQIADVKNAIEQNENLTTSEKLKKGFDSIIDAFGPMLFSILKMFGFGKGSLLELFPNYKDKINEKFKEEYGLSKEAIDSINEISKKHSPDLLPNLSKPWPTAKELKDNMGDNNYYIEKLLPKDDTYKYIKYINVSVFQNGLNIYNKKNKPETNINDIVNIETDKTDKTNKKQSITTIKKGFEFKFNEVIKTILDSDDTRIKIAGANEKIQTPRMKKDIPQPTTEQGLTEKQAENYGIKSQQDIARYLTASLFSNKDLSYVITENELKGKEKNTETLKKYTVTNVSNLRSSMNPLEVIKEVKENEVVTEIPDNKQQQQKNTAKGLGLTAADFPGDKDRESKEYIIVRTDTNNEGWILLSNITDQPKENTDKPVETPEQKFTKNRELISGDKKMNNDKKLYGTFDFTKFTYNKEAKLVDQQEYQTNILESFERILADKEQYSLLVEKMNYKNPTYEGQFPIHLANVLNMIDIKNNKTDHKANIEELKKFGDKYQITINKETNTIIISSETEKKKIILGQEEKDGIIKLTTKLEDNTSSNPK